MSLRRLYKSVPKDKRICSYYRCQKPILRNIDECDGQIIHHGCLLSAKEDKFYCYDCSTELDGTEVGLVDYGEEKTVFACKFCGGTNLKTPEGRRREWLTKRMEDMF